MILSIIFMIFWYNLFMKTFGEKIKELRKEKGLTQKELAAKIGQAQSTIFYWEQDKQKPDIYSLKKLCDLFDVPADYLIGRIDEY